MDVNAVFPSLRTFNWLHENFIASEGEQILTSQFRSSCPVKQDASRIGEVLCKAFPKVERSRVRKGSKLEHVYTNIAAISPDDTGIINSSELQKYNSNGFSQDCRNLVSFDTFQWFFFYDDLCEGRRIGKTIRIFTDFTYEVAVETLNRKVVIPVNSEKLKNMASLTALFKYVESARICRGFPVDVNKDTRGKEGKIIGRTTSWSRLDTDSVELRHISLECQGLVDLTRRSDLCYTCANVKHNCCQFLANSDDTPDMKVDDMVEFCEEDHEDLLTMFQNISPEQMSEDQKLLWKQQMMALKVKGPKGFRWHPKIIRLCLSIWNRSPEAYEELRGCGMLRLPSGRLLCYYKNSVSQEPGINDEVISWMKEEADKRNIGSHGRCGGIILDEMSIQEDLQLKKVGRQSKLVGFVNLGEEHQAMSTLINGKEIDVKTASHVLQFVFLGYTGFRFPFAHWPTGEVDPSTLCRKFWQAVFCLWSVGFAVHFCVCDGGSSNPSFIQAHFKGKDPVAERFTVVNPYTRGQLVFILDPYHNFKKLRNNVEKSSKNGVRQLKVGSNCVEWRQWRMAYKWDQEENSLSIHERLTEHHLNLGYASRMRNHLAIDVLSNKMLNLFKAFKDFLSRRQVDVTYLDATMEFLETTAVLVEFFEDMKPITSMADERLRKLQQCHEWFSNWEEDAKLSEKRSVDQRHRMLSDKLRFDIHSTLLGFQEICKIALQENPGSGVIPAYINSNLVENIFCQERGRNGQNSNPTYIQYGPTMNGILLGQRTTTYRSNTGYSADDFAFCKPSKLKKRSGVALEKA